MVKKIFDAVRDSLTPELLAKGFSGHCYIASEAYYHLAGGASEYITPHSMKVDGTSHWFLKDGVGNIIDLTIDQFSSVPNYFHESARGRGFLTKQPSKRAQIVIERAKGKLGWP